jgi:hypothetical protein
VCRDRGRGRIAGGQGERHFFRSRHPARGNDQPQVDNNTARRISDLQERYLTNQPPRYNSSNNPCPIPGTLMAMADFGKQMQLFSDVTNTAETTPKIFLQDKIFEMQEIKENTESIPISHCMETLREYVLNGHQKTIDMYLLFVGGGSDQDIRAKREEANGWFDMADREVDNIFRDPAGLKTGYE